jgi:tetratricopeptide (TPR) repeat protein
MCRFTLLAFSLVLAPITAWAQAPEAAPVTNASPQQVAAKALYQQGVAFFRAGKFEAAAGLFKAAYEQDQSPTLLYNLARTYEEMGEPAQAAAHFQNYVELYPEAADRSDVERRLASLEAIVRGSAPGRLMVEAVPEGAVVFIDDVRVEPGPDGLWLLSKGLHIIRVEQAGFEPWRTNVEIAPKKQHTITWQATEPLAVPAPEVVVVERPLGWKGIAGWSSIGLSVALTSLGVVFHTQANGAKQDYDAATDALEGRRIDNEAGVVALDNRLDAQARYDTKRGLAVGLYAGAAVAAIVGVGLLYFDEGAEIGPGRVQVGAGPQGLWLMGSF